MNYTKIFGMQRTGTSFTYMLMCLNFKDTFVCNNEFGHKHDLPFTLDEMRSLTMSSDDVNKELCMEGLKDFDNGAVIHPVVIIKNPYSWFKSISGWGAVNIRNYSLEGVYDKYNKFYDCMYKFLQAPLPPFGCGHAIRFRDLLVDPHDILLSLSNEFNIELNDRDAVIRPSGHPYDYFTEDRRKFYLGKTFELTRSEIDTVNELVNWSVISQYGYTKVVI